MHAELAVVREDQVFREVGIRGIRYQAGQRAVDEQERGELVAEGDAVGEQQRAVAARLGPRAAGFDAGLLLVIG